jgi:hypothetical protein
MTPVFEVHRYSDVSVSDVHSPEVWFYVTATQSHAIVSANLMAIPLFHPPFYCDQLLVSKNRHIVHVESRLDRSVFTAVCCIL